MADPKDLYGTFGSVPDLSSQGSATFGQRLSVKASPNDFGAQIGEAQQYAGKVKQETGERLTDWAIKQQGMLNETLANNALGEYQIEVAKRKAEFDSLEGLSAVQAKQKYVSEISELRKQYSSRLSGGALRAFELSSADVEYSHIAQAESYAIQQAKQAHRDSMLLSVNLAQTGMQDPSRAGDMASIGKALGDVSYSYQSLLDEDTPGVIFDPETQTHKFADTPEGIQAREKLNSDIKYGQGIVWENSINTVAKNDPLKASQIYAENKDSIDPEARMRIEASLAPRVIDYYATTAVRESQDQIARGHREAVTKSSMGSNPFNLGNVKTRRGAAENIAEFVQPATAVDGVILTANNLRKNYQGLSLEQIGNKWAPPSENVTSDWVKNVSAASGIAPGEVPDLNSPETLKKLLRGIAVAEKSPKDREAFTEAVLSQGVQDALAGKNAVEAAQPAGVPQQNYPKNQFGGPLTRADWAATNRMEILSYWENWAEQQAPGNATFRKQVVARIEAQITDMVQQQNAEQRQDRLVVQQAINGAFTDGKPPLSYEQLKSIPDVAEVLLRTEVHSPDFTRDIDAKIERVSGAAGKDAKQYGPAFFNLMRDINAGVITNQDELIAHLPSNDSPGDLTFAGYTQLLREFAADTPEKKSEQDMRVDSFNFIKEMILDDPDESNADRTTRAKWAQAQPILYKAIEEGKKNGLTMGELTDPQNPHWIGNSVKSLIPTDVQKEINTITGWDVPDESITDKITTAADVVSQRINLMLAIKEARSSGNQEEVEKLMQQGEKRGWFKRKKTFEQETGVSVPVSE